ncbi:MAG TPA: DUF423 domain-containing protein [Gemmatimonadales bacterium]|jgi:uncharacterized membrane protein YgdD (TMEM256/DUF423 family)|nr:DUF423 domain-containing protein [Gemmatimonadales bacterium]
MAATIGALFGALGVILGAFGAHALKTRLDAHLLGVYETAVRYQMYHAFALLASAWLLSRNAPGAAAAAWCFVAGVVVFSGSLYLLVATGQNWWGAVTPIGGLALIAGWLLLARGAWGTVA